MQQGKSGDEKIRNLSLQYSLRGFLVLFFILSFGVPVFSQGLSYTSNEFYQKGRQAYNAGQYKEAQTDYKQALAILYQTPGQQGGALEKELQQGLQLSSSNAVYQTQPEEQKVPLEQGPQQGLQQPVSFASVAANTTEEKEVSTPQAVKPLVYTITEGDVLYISVWQEEGLSQEVTVRPDGMISFPLVGDISAAGLTIPQLRTELTEKLKDYIKYPEVAVSIRKFGVGEILVLGQVNSPGVYTVEGGKTTVLDMIIKAGNFTQNADSSRVIITHRGITNAKGIATGTRVNLNRLLKNADMSQNIVLNPQDMLYVPERNASSKFFGGTGEILVLGQVNSPGSYTVVGGKTTVLDAVVKAGSFTKNADLTSVVITHRGIINAKGIATGTRINLDRVIMNADMSQNIVLNPEDMVYVPEKVVSDKLGPGDILVLGQVNFPGIYGVAASKPTILSVIALAGGFTPSAVLSSVIVIHRAKTNAKGIATAVRIDLNRMIMHADMSQNIVLSAQDLVYVPEKFIANLNYFLSQVFNPITGAAQTAVNLRKLTW